MLPGRVKRSQLSCEATCTSWGQHQASLGRVIAVMERDGILLFAGLAVIDRRP